MKRRFAVVLALLPLVPFVTLSAQSADTLPFRAGQWGAEFVAGSGFGGVGVLRFLTPSRALLLDGNASWEDYRRDAPSNESQRDNLNLRLGYRWYRVARARVVQSLTVGISAHRSNDARDFGSEGLEQVDRGTGAGAFGELGAAWMVMPQLALGATWSGSLRYTWVTSRGPSMIVGAPPVVERKGSTLQANIGQLGLRVSLFF